jgi:hypothetical protein
VGNPKRIQRKRTRGWRMPPGAVYVGRPTKWGNPYPVGVVPATVNGESARVLVTASMAVDRYRDWLVGEILAGRLDLDELRGRDLACWCPREQACHADVLLSAVNRGFR